jgi:hypothetical protein
MPNRNSSRSDCGPSGGAAIGIWVSHATVAGHNLLADPLGVRRSISLTGQYAAVDDVLTGAETCR